MSIRCLKKLSMVSNAEGKGTVDLSLEISLLQNEFQLCSIVATDESGYQPQSGMLRIQQILDNTISHIFSSVISSGVVLGSGVNRGDRRRGNSQRQSLIHQHQILSRFRCTQQQLVISMIASTV
jgi:hypothetical protein